MTKSLIRLRAFLHEAINSPVIVEPVETSFHLPALPRVPRFPEFNRKNLGAVVGAADNTGNDMPFSQTIP